MTNCNSVARLFLICALFIQTLSERLIRTQGATSGVLGTNVVSWSANVVTAGLRQNGLIELQMTLQSSDDEQISVVHEVHFPNVP